MSDVGKLKRDIQGMLHLLCSSSCPGPLTCPTTDAAAKFCGGKPSDYVFNLGGILVRNLAGENFHQDMHIQLWNITEEVEKDLIYAREKRVPIENFRAEEEYILGEMLARLKSITEKNKIK